MISKKTHLLILLFSLLLLFSCASVDKAFPNKKAGPIADSLATKIMEATHYEVWQQTAVIGWTFAGKNKHIWDKSRNYARVEWKKNIVIFDIGTKHGRAWKDGEEVFGEKLKELIDKAWHSWANDSFWLNPFAKLFDEGAERAYVKTKDNKDALLITYSSGGITPGDSYLWIVDDNGLPEKVKMWVSIIPVNGIGISWEGWETLSTGVKIANSHKLSFINLKLTDIKASRSMSEFSQKNLFEGL